MSSIWEPLQNLLTESQLQSMLMAWIPFQFQSFLTGVAMLDMFISTFLVTLIVAYAKHARNLYFNPYWTRQNNVIRIDRFKNSFWGNEPSSIYEALSWFISMKCKELHYGKFVLKYDEYSEDYFSPTLSVLPENNQSLTYSYNNYILHITFRFQTPDPVAVLLKEKHRGYAGTLMRGEFIPMPSIFLTVHNTLYSKKFQNLSTNETLSIILSITKDYENFKKNKKERRRFTWSQNRWNNFQSLPNNNGFSCIALDQSQEELLKRELHSFVSSEDYYTKIGAPYKLGLFLYGEPGTGKTSLINSISAELKRDLYFINLGNFSSNEELVLAFSSVPSNQIIVMEDVDAHTKAIHNRKLIASYTGDNFSTGTSTDLDQDQSHSEKDSGKSKESFSLNTFLECLDGHVLAKGMITIMTTNYVDKLDPACIRNGRMDIHLSLERCTRYQLNRLYKIIRNSDSEEFPHEILNTIPEKKIVPCVAFTIMLSSNKNPEKIPELILSHITTNKS